MGGQYTTTTHSILENAASADASSDAGPVPSQWLAEGLFNVFKRFRLRLMFLRNVPHGAMAFQPLDEPVPIYVDA